MDSDESYFETTYSQDERIAKSLKEAKSEEIRRKLLKDANRKKLFEQYLEEKSLPIFHIEGLEIIKLTHLKIKIAFQPSKVVKYVHPKIKFYCSLRYREDNWIIKRNTIPSNYKFRIFNIFYSDSGFAVNDENIIDAILTIYRKLVVWAQNEEKIRLEKFRRYRNKESDVELDSEEEEVFLSIAERAELNSKRVKVLKRMLPPKKKRLDSYL